MSNNSAWNQMLDRVQQVVAPRPVAQPTPSPSPAPTSSPRGGARGDRNNNSGNLEDGAWARSQPGYVGSDGRFARFARPEDGHAAQENLLRNGRRYRGQPLSRVIQTYAPVGDNSEASVRNYIGYVAARAGIDPDQPIPDAAYSTIASAMREFENGRTLDMRFSPYGGAVGGRNVSTQSQNASAAPGDFLAQVQSALGPEVAASSGVTIPADKIFTAGPELAARAATVEGNLRQEGAAIGVLDQVTQAAHTAAQEAMTRQLETTRAISGEIMRGTKELQAQVTPVFQARGRIADQLDRLNTMNPLERGLRGIFDLNYDTDYLEGQLDRFDRTLQARSQDYQYLNELHGNALQEVNRRYQMDTALPDLMADQAEQDLNLVHLAVANSGNLLDSLRGQVSQETQMISAQNLARETLMSRLDTPTRTDLMNQAQANGGTVNFNGVQFSYAELRTSVQNSESQELSIQGARMAIANNQMDLADKYTQNLARTMTRPQIEAAMANGGNFNGVTIPLDTLNQVYQSQTQYAQQLAENTVNSTPGSTALRVGSNYVGQAIALNRRGRQILGNGAMAPANQILAQQNELGQRLMEAVNTNQPPEVITALTAQMAQAQQQMTEFVDQRLLDSVGGDRRAAGYLRSFTYGGEINEGTAAEAMAYFAVKGNMPQGMRLSPEVRQVFQRAQRTVAENQTNARGQRTSEAELLRLVTEDLTANAPDIVGQGRFESIYGDLPRVAQMAGHQFGSFDPTRWAEVRGAASRTAAESIAAELNTTPENVIQMMRTGRPLTREQMGQGPSSSRQNPAIAAASTLPLVGPVVVGANALFGGGGESAAANRTPEQLLEATLGLASRYNAVELQTTVQLLDQEPQVQQGRRNSSVALDFLGSPRFAQGLQSYSQGLAGNSFGEYLVNPLAQGAVERNFNDTRGYITDSQAAVYATERNLARNPEAAMIFRPVPRISQVLSSIPALSGEGARALLPFVQQFARQINEGQVDTSFGILRSTQFANQDQAFLSALQSTTFEDARLENYRKAAVRAYPDAATQYRGFTERLIETMGAVAPFEGDDPWDSPFTQQVYED